MKNIVFDRLAVKLVFWLVLFCSGLTVLGTGVQLYLDYQNDIEQVFGSIDAAATPHIEEVSSKVQAGDSRGVNNFLKQLLSRDGFAYAAIIVDNRVTWEQGLKVSGDHICAVFPLSRTPHQGGEFASLEVTADVKLLQDHVYQRIIQMLISNGVRIFIIAGFVFLMVQFLVTRHLETLAQQVQGLDPSKPYSPLEIFRSASNRNDELQQVVAGVNTMQRRARDVYELLAKNEERLLLFFDSTEEAILGIDSDGLCSFANDSCLGLLGISSYEEIIGSELRHLFVHSRGDSRKYETEKCIITQSMQQAQALHCDDGFIVVPGGNTLYVSLRCYPVFKRGEVTGALIFMNDNAEKRLLQRERELLSEAVRQIPVMITIADLDSGIQYVNPGTERLTGFMRDEMIGKSMLHFYELLGVGDNASPAEIEEILKSGGQWEGVIEVVAKHGTPLKFYSQIFPVFDDEGLIVNVVSVSREVSYEIKLQNELINAKKMEAVGRLSASFAHEFGNPLFGVSAVLKDINERVPFTEEDGTLLGLAHGECERMRNMVREFQQLYRDSASGEDFTLLSDIIESVVRDLAPMMQVYRVRYHLVLSEEARNVEVNGSKLSMVIKNVVLNGVESMSKSGGDLNITTAMGEKYLTVTVGDAGAGIKREHQEMIFEPFFSTKPEVEGAGLGLSVAYGTMRSLGGSITFSTEENRGTCFKVLIPNV